MTIMECRLVESECGRYARCTKLPARAGRKSSATKPYDTVTNISVVLILPSLQSNNSLLLSRDCYR